MTEPFNNEIDFMSAIIRIGASLIAAILLVSLFVPVHAENVTGNITGNFTDNTTVIAPINQSFIPYLYQGDTAYVGTYVDISGVAPPYPSLAYWDGFDMYNSVPSYNYTLPDSKKGYYLFYIDPEIFANRTGWWYKYNGEFEPQGNNRAFYVLPQAMHNITMRLQNGTLVNITNIETISNYTEHVIPEAPLMPERHVADYVVAKGDPVVWDEGGYHLWVFGRINGVYDNPSNVIPEDVVQTLENGDYLIVVHSPGTDGNFDARYDAKSKTLIPYRYGKEPVDINGLTPNLVYDRLKIMLADTDDKLYEYNLQVDIPQITINQADEVYRESVSFLDVRGYTNVANGTPITVTLDENGYSDYKASTTAVRTSNGNMSYYRAYVPFSFDDLAADARNHTLVARTAIGGASYKDFKVSLMPADSFKPNASLKYIEDRNPFVPTPTPEVVVVTKTVEVKVKVTVPVTPSDAQVYAQQKAAEDAKWNEIVVIVGERALLVVLGILLASAIWYFASVWKRGRQNE